VTSFTQLAVYQTWENHAACTSYPEGECNRITRNVARCLQNSTSWYTRIPPSQYLSLYNITVGGTAVNSGGILQVVGSLSENVSYYNTKCKA